MFRPVGPGRTKSAGPSQQFPSSPDEIPQHKTGQEKCGAQVLEKGVGRTRGGRAKDFFHLPPGSQFGGYGSSRGLAAGVHHDFFYGNQRSEARDKAIANRMGNDSCANLRLFVLAGLPPTVHQLFDAWARPERGDSRMESRLRSIERDGGLIRVIARTSRQMQQANTSF